MLHTGIKFISPTERTCPQAMADINERNTEEKIKKITLLSYLNSILRTVK
jgi:hypothetical protein